MKRLDTKQMHRQIDIVDFLQKNKLTTTTDLATHFNVPESTIELDIKSLIEAGLPVVNTGDKGHKLTEDINKPLKAEFVKNVIHVNDRSEYYLTDLQSALITFKLIKIKYIDASGVETIRIIEPYALFSTVEGWIVVAYCKLREDYRYFRLERILKLDILDESFEHRNITMQEFFYRFENL